MSNTRRFIEESFPVKEVGIESAREKNIRHGHISTLHIWWARRPLASSRATNYAALIPAPENVDDWNKTREFIINFSKWENSLDQSMIQKAREDILKANGGKPPKVLDPFGGGGAIPLEALRLGCETYSNDLNPVAVLIQKCTLEYPQKYGRLGMGNGKLGTTKKEGRNEHTELSGSGCLEDGYGTGSGDIQNNEGVSEGGKIRDDLSNTEGSGIGSSEHSGGMGTGFNKGIHPISEDSTGINVRTGNTSHDSQQDRLHLEGSFGENTSKDRIHRKDAAGTYTFFGREIESPFPISNPLLADVKKWSNWVLEEAKKEIGKFYPEEPDGSIPVGYIWARTISCQNPSCIDRDGQSTQIPLMRQFWLAKKDNKKVVLFPYVEEVEQPSRLSSKVSRLSFKIVGDGYENMHDGFDPENGTVARAVATCPVCGSVVDAKTTRRLFQEGKAGERMVAVVLHHPKRQGKTYRIAAEKDMEIFREAEESLKEKREKLMAEWGMEPVPDELIPTPCHDVDRPPMYGMNTWGDLFNARQKLALITFMEEVKKVHRKLKDEGFEEEYAKAVVSYLALGITRTADFTSNLARWKPDAKAIVQGMTRQALAMVFDYTENNVVSDTAGTWSSLLDRMLGVIPNLSTIPNNFAIITQAGTSGILPAQDSHVAVTHASATALPYNDNFFDAIFTDPPYYDNVGYANLSDFFYVWLKRTLGELYPELFSTPLTPKSNEVVSDPYRHGGKDAAREFFESMLKKSFQEIHRVLKPDGIAVIVYAHKSTEGWETLINSLLDSGLVMTGAWPLSTEMGSRLNANETASLASSIYIVARKMKRLPTGFYNEVKEELKQHLNKKLERLWLEGIGGADFFIAAIGSAIEVFGKYEKVMDFEGNVIRADKMLEDVRSIATNYAVRKILHNGFAGEISDLTRFYVLFRWNYGEAKVQFDEARKLAQSCGIDLAHEWNKQGVIRKEKEFIKLLGPQDRKQEEIKHPTELTDVLHNVLLYWERSKRNEMLELLKESGYGKSEAFYRVAQAISETLPNESKEKKLLDGFLAGKERLREEITKESSMPKQKKLL